MKNNTGSKISKLNKPIDTSRPEHWELCKIIQAERARKIMSAIESVFYYDDAAGKAGFGFNAAGELMEYSIPRSGCMEDVEDNTSIEAITIAQSLEWVRSMHWAESRLDFTLQEGAGFPRWIEALQATLSNLTGAAFPGLNTAGKVAGK